MATQINPGSRCIVTRDIQVGGQFAFTRDEQVVVEDVSPNPQQPESKYIVYSQRLQQRYQLSDLDLSPYPVEQPAVAQSPYQQVAPSPSGYPAQPPAGYGAAILPGGYAGVPVKKKFPVWGIVLIVVASLLVIAIPVAFFVVVPIFTSANSSANMRTCQANLRTIDSAINTYNGEYDAYPPDGEVGEILVPELIKITPTCPTTGRTYVMENGGDGVPPTVNCPTNEPGHDY